MAPTPSSDEREELLLSCRYGDLDDVKQFVDKFGGDALRDIRDDNGNSVLHMICGNGHEDILDYFLANLPSEVLSILLSSSNNAQSTPLHWAAVNSQLSTSQKLVRYPSGPGVRLIDTKNAAGRTPLGEAELSGWEEGAKWFVEVMNLDEAPQATETGEDVGDEDVGVDAKDIEVEIEDADGKVAKLSISGKDVDVARQMQKGST